MFESHGRYSLNVIDQTLFVDIVGPMDLELAKNIFADARQLVKRHFKGQWASYVNLEQWQLFTPEIMPNMHEFQIWCEKNKLAVEVCLVGSSAMKRAARESMVMEGSDTQIHYVQSQQQGIDWLKRKGFLAGDYEDH